MTSLTQQSLDVIKQYESLQFGDNTVVTPYFNNKRQKVRGALRVLVGKGTPQDIVEEAQLIARREHVDLNGMSANEITKFLVDHHLGIDCSGFVYHVLNADDSLKKRLKFRAASPLRKILTKLRPAENTNVKVLADDRNSTEVSLSNIKPGDIITLIGSKKVGNPDHALLVTSVSDENIEFAHAFTLPGDGLYGHGIKRGSIRILNAAKSLTEQQWSDDKMKDYIQHSEPAVQLRRLRIS